MEQSKYYLGFTSLNQEITKKQLKIEGTLPSWLRGTLLRTGPAQFEVEKQKYNHWFDGLAMLFAFKFSEDHISYSNRFLQSASYCEAMETKKIAHAEFGTTPSRSFFERIKAIFNPHLTDNCNVSINKFADEIIALTETRFPIRFDPETLETIGKYEYDENPGDSLSGRISTAHPHFDFERNCHYSYLTNLGRQSSYCIFSMDVKTGHQRIISTISAKHPSYMHSFGMSKKYLIITQIPLVIYPLKLMFSTTPFVSNLKWKPNRGVQFIIIEKETGKIINKIDYDAFFAFHHVNAFEERGDENVVNLDIITYPDASIIDQLYLKYLRSSAPVDATGILTRFKIDLKNSKEIGKEILSKVPMDLPRINYGMYSGIPYRFVFAAGSENNSENNDFFTNLVKVDLEHDTSMLWSSSHCYPGEPVFVASPNAQKEDDGVILSLIFDAKEEKSFLLILDASSWKEITRVNLPHCIPFGFHGNYFTELSGDLSFLHLHR
ncbi:MAG: Dioxygenase [Promethearchaeota archaeon]|nr:MAG: Dioxygenase [Candidatus Lokiarchaeota archaeon]